MRLGNVLGWGLRLVLSAVVLLLVGGVLAVLLVTFEGRSTFPAPLRDDAAIARHMPDYRHREAYEVGTDAEPAQVYAMLRTADLRRIPALRLYLEAKDAPGRVAALFGRAFHRPTAVTLDTLAALTGFTLLEERPGQSVVLGYIGQPWHPGAPRPPFTTETFTRLATPGYIRSTWSFEVVPRSGGGSRLIIEWRTDPTDVQAMREFGRYWLVARPFTQLMAKTGLPLITEGSAGVANR
jgi:hypothetical protein